MKILTILLLFALSFNVLSQTAIRGIISDDLGPLSGANIIIKNSNKGVVSNIDGVYEIKAKPTDTLSISYLGYVTKDVLINNQMSINTFLSGDIKLDEVVVVSYRVMTKTCVLRCNVFSIKCESACEVISEDVKPTIFKSDLITPKLYPNPSIEGRFKLTLLNNYRNIQMQVSNISGQIIKVDNYQKNTKQLNVDLSQFPSGIYIINIIADGKQLPAKKAIIGG